MKVLLLTNNEITYEVYNWLRNKEEVILYSHKIDIEYIEAKNIEFIVSYNYKYLISEEIINYMNGKVVNLHISLLPWNKGADPNIWSYIDNTPKGVTIHNVDNKLDEGDILCQKEVYLDTRESFASSYTELNKEITKLFKENWEDIKNLKLKPKKQLLKGTYHRRSDLSSVRELIKFDEKIENIIHDIKGRVKNGI